MRCATSMPRPIFIGDLVLMSAPATGIHGVRTIRLFNCLVSSLSFGQSPPDKIGDDGFSRPFAAYKRDFVQRHEACRCLFWSRKTPMLIFVRLILQARTRCALSVKASARTVRP